MIDAGVEPDVAHHRLIQGWPPEHVGQAAEAAPVVGNGTAAARDDQAQVREVLEQVALNAVVSPFR